MQFTLATVIAVLPFLTAALPNPHQAIPDGARIGINIPISKRSSMVGQDGFIDIDNIRKHVAYVERKILNGAKAAEKNTGVNFTRPRASSSATIRRQLPVLHARGAPTSLKRYMDHPSVKHSHSASTTPTSHPHWGPGPVQLTNRGATHGGPYGQPDAPEPTAPSGRAGRNPPTGNHPDTGSGSHSHGQGQQGGHHGGGEPDTVPSHGGHGGGSPAPKPHTSTAAPRPTHGVPGKGGNDGTAGVVSDPLDTTTGAVWFGKVSVGTPPVEFTVDFDTGSSDFFVPSARCRTGCEGHATWDPSSSSTAKDSGKSFQLAFGDGSSVMGEVFVDTFSIGDLTVDQQAVGAATQYSAGFTQPQFPSDGLLGLGFAATSEFGAPNPIQALADQGSLADPVFAFKLTADGTGSELTVGGLNENLFSGEVTFTPVTRKGLWQIDMDGVDVNGKQALGKTSVLVDSGTTLVIGDADQVAQVYAGIQGAQDASSLGPGLFTVPCQSVPTISLTFGGKAFDMSSDTFILGAVDEENCVGSIVSGDLQGVVEWIVGDVFMENVYTVFDIGNSKIGFAELA